MIVKILRESSVYGIIGVLSAFTGTFITPIYTRIFSSADYATLDFLIASLVILTIISGTWIDAGLARNYYLAKERGEADHLVSTGLVLCFISIAIFTVLSGFIYTMFLQGYADTNWGTMLPLLAILLPRRLHVFLLQIFRLEHNPKHFLLIAIGQIITSTILSVLFGFRLGIAGVLWAYAIGRLVFAAVGLFIIRKRIGLIFDRREAKNAFAFGVPLLPAFLSQWVQNYAGRIILIATVTLTQVSHFSLALKIASFASIFLIAFNQAWVPYYNEMLDHSEGDEKFPRMLNFYLVGMLFVTTLIGAFSTLLVRVFGTVDYLPAVSLITFIAMGIIWDGSLKIVDAGISKMRKTQWTGIAVAMGWGVYLVAALTLVPNFGALAIAFSYLAGTSCTSLSILYVAQRLYPMPYDKTIIFGTVAACWGISILNATILSQVDIDTSSLLKQICLSLGIGLSLWLILAWRLIQIEDVSRVKKWAFNYLPKQLR